MALSTITVTGTWVTPTNVAPASGTVTFQPVQEAVGGGYMVAGSPVNAALSAGAISIALVNNTQATSLQYQVTENIAGAPAVTYVISPTGSTLDLSTVFRGSVSPLPSYGAGKAVGTFTGTGSTTSFPVTHNLGNLAPVWSVYSGTQQYWPEFQPSTSNAGNIVWTTAPANGVVYTYTLLG